MKHAASFRPSLFIFLQLILSSRLQYNNIQFIIQPFEYFCNMTGVSLQNFSCMTSHLAWEPPTQTILHDRFILIPNETSLCWPDVNVSNWFLSNETWHWSNASASYMDVTFTVQVNCKHSLFRGDVVHSFTQVC